MTALHIRKNLAFILHSAAEAVENVQLRKPDASVVKTVRRKIANAIAPKD